MVQAKTTTKTTTLAPVRLCPPSKSCAGAACAKPDRVKAAKRRNITGPSIYCYITYITLIMRLAGLEKVAITKGVIAVL